MNGKYRCWLWTLILCWLSLGMFSCASAKAPLTKTPKTAQLQPVNQTPAAAKSHAAAVSAKSRVSEKSASAASPVVSSVAFENLPPKHEFRGAWISTIHQAKYAQMNQFQMQMYFENLLDSLQAAGINVVLFQVRPQCDAWYKSSYEPWSSFITGKQGKNPGWDPLFYITEACHRRNMDIHAWINPYRVKLTLKEGDLKEPFVRKYRHLMLRYGRSLWLDPALPESQKHILKVVREIVRNYDIDGIHMDDYFYPYPIAGQDFPDDKSFAKYGAAQGFLPSQKADWRRYQVNTLVRDLHQVIRQEKPWVRFGISPFGIHRNLKQDPDGSKTNGLSNYDDLYADALTWMREGWIDYCIPQLYWEIGHPAADYTTLLDWWSHHSYGTALYIGQDVTRTMKPKQLTAKMDQARAQAGVQGNCYFPAYELEANFGGVSDSLAAKWHQYPALVPADNLDYHVEPEPVYSLDLLHDFDKGLYLSWKSPYTRNEMKKASYYVVYRFPKTSVNASVSEENLQDPRAIVGITRQPYFSLPSHPHAGEWVYHVTAVNRLHIESASERMVVKVNYKKQK